MSYTERMQGIATQYRDAGQSWPALKTEIAKGESRTSYGLRIHRPLSLSVLTTLLVPCGKSILPIRKGVVFAPST